MMMKAGLFNAPNDLCVTDVEAPTAGPGEVLIRVRAAGICGTDVHILKGEYEATYPIIPGHEFSGVVAEVGPGVGRYQPGDRVTADPNIPCETCSECQRNAPNQCKNLAAIGVTRHGGFADYVVAPAKTVFAIGDISFEEAALIEPLACVVWGLKRVQAQPGDRALILGAGPMGCLLLQGLRAAGASLTVITDVVEDRLDLAKSLGASAVVIANQDQDTLLRKHAPDGFDIVVDATGIPAVINTAIHHVRPRGKLWIFGVTPQGASVSLPSYDIFRKDIQVIGSFAVNRTFPESINLVKSGAVKLRPLISHQFSLQDFSEAFHTVQDDLNRMKVQFTIQ